MLTPAGTLLIVRKWQLLSLPGRGERSKKSGGFHNLTAGLCINCRSKNWARI